MPKFIRVERDQGTIFINVNDIHWIKVTENGDAEVNYASPGMPTMNRVIASRDELSKTWTLDELIAVNKI